MNDVDDLSLRDQRINEILAAYLKAVDADQAPSRQELLAEHPDLAVPLQAFFADHDELDQLAAPVRNESNARPEPVVLSPLPGEGLVDETLSLAESAIGPGTRVRYFGDYELLEEIARGGMGVVYKARQVSLNRIVAIKMILAGGFASDAEVRRFHTEAAAAANLDHPNIVPIYEVGEYQGQHYFSMKLAEGGSLADHLDQFIGDPRAAARLLIAVARAVAHAHQHGLLHRDLKPANVLLASKPQANSQERRGSAHPVRNSPDSELMDVSPLVTDFGLVKHVGDQPGASTGRNATRSGAIVGTPSYMAPEQAASKKGLTTAVDVYSLGAILYELLTGRPPFRAETPLDVLLQVMDREPERPRQLNPDVDGDLETICLKCLHKDPERRYATASALAEELERWLKGEPIHARRTSIGERTVMWARRRPAAAALAAVSCTAVVLLLALAGFLWHNAELRAEAVQNLQAARREQQEARTEAAAQEQLAEQKRHEVRQLDQIAQEDRARADAARESARHARYAADLQLAHAAWETGNVQRLAGLLDRHRPAAGEPDLRGFEWNYLWRLGHGERWTFRAAPTPKPAPAEERSPLDGLNAQSVLVALSPDGRTLASASSEEKIRLWDLATGKERQVLAQPAGPVVSLAFGNDGKELVVVAFRKQGNDSPGPDIAGIQAVASGQAKPSVQPFLKLFAVQTLPLDGGQPRAAGALAPSVLRTPLSIMAGGREVLMALVTAVIPLDRNRLFSTMAVAASPDGKLLAFGGLATLKGGTPREPKMEQIGAILLWDVAAGREKSLLLNPAGPVDALAFSPDGLTLASGSFDRTIKLWDVASGRDRATLRGHAAMVLAISFAADGKRLASGSSDGIIKVWDPATGSLQFECKGQLQGVSALAWTPDGGTLASGSMDGLVKVWDLAKVQGTPMEKTFAKPLTALTFTPEGRAVAALDQGGLLQVIDAAKGTTLVRHQLKTEIRFNFSGALAPDGRTAALGGVTPTVRLYDVTTGQERASLPGHAGVVYCLAFSPNSQTLAAGTGDGQNSGEIKLWDPATGKLRHTLSGYRKRVEALAFSPDGKTLAGAGGDPRVRLWDVATGRERLNFDGGGPVKALAYSPDGQRLALASGETIAFREAATGKVLLTMPTYGHEPATLAFSPDGRRLVTGGGEGELGRGGGVKLWDTVTGEEILSLGGTSAVISCVAFSPEGGRLAAASGGVFLFLNQTGGTVTVWDGRPPEGTQAQPGPAKPAPAK